MLDYALSRDLMSLSEMNHLRLKAMRLFEDCLTNGDDQALVDFIESQLVQDPPQLHLLRDVADDLQQRLLSLREHHFDVRERVVRMLSESYDIDITPLAPPNKLETYHYLKLQDVTAYIQQHSEDVGGDELTMLEKMVSASIETAAQLQRDVKMAAHLHRLVVDWLEGISTVTARRHWPSSGGMFSEQAETSTLH